MRIMGRKKRERVKIFEGNLEDIKERAAELIADVIGKVDEMSKFVGGIRGISIEDSKIGIARTERGDIEVELHFTLLLKRK